MPNPLLPRPRWRLIIFWIVFLYLAGIFSGQQRQILEQISQNTPWKSLPNTASQEADLSSPFTAETVITRIQDRRKAADFPSLALNDSLQKVSRFITLELEDQQSLDIPNNLQTLLININPAIPPRVEVLTAFIARGGSIAHLDEQIGQLVVAQPTYTQLGVAVRSASINGTSGELIVIMASPPFAEPVLNSSTAAITQPSQPPAYTGHDLWQAVNNYRRAHNLPEFTQANELCTVASIRLNEQLELGRLDNHDGFQPRADEFFEDHPEWKSINENLASGYQTAVATVEWGWDQSLGHQALIKSTAENYACTASNRGFAVLITGAKR